METTSPSFNQFTFLYRQLGLTDFWCQSDDCFYQPITYLFVTYAGVGISLPFIRFFGKDGKMLDDKPDCLPIDYKKTRIHPLLYVPYCNAFLWQSSFRQWEKMLKKYIHGYWYLFIDLFPIHTDLKKKIWYILGYLMFFHPNLKIVTRSKRELRDRLTPLYCLIKGYELK